MRPQPEPIERTETAVVVRAWNIEDERWETLGRGDEAGNRARWWAEHATPGVYEDFTTVRYTSTQTFKYEEI